MGEMGVQLDLEGVNNIMSHLNDDDIVILTTLNINTLEHSENQRITKKKGKEYIDKAKSIEYQDNDYFGRLSLSGISQDEDVIHNLLFVQNT
jgi:hypothetical protein